MPKQFEFLAEGILKAVEVIDGLDAKVNTAASRAVNKTLDHARAELARDMESQLAFPTGYLMPSKGRFVVAKRASPTSLEGAIRGRDMPTSLARFAKGGTPQSTRKAGEVVVGVKRTSTKRMKGAFLVNLRNGNLGLAIRLPKGVTPSKAYKPRRLGNSGTWLLYGPSVDQAFRMVLETGVPESDAAAYLEIEFLRLMGL